MIACIAGCLVLLALIPRQGATPRPTVQVPDIAREVVDTSKWNVATADGLGSPWRPVNAQMIAGDSDHMQHWQVGYQGKGSQFVAVEQAKNGGSRFVDEMAHGTQSGSMNLAGATWTKINLDSGDQKALVRSNPLAGLDTMVVGVGSWDQLAQVASATKPFKASH